VSDAEPPVPPLRLKPIRREDTILRGAGFVFASKVGASAFTAVLVIFLTRALGAGGYGVFALGLSIITLVDLPSDFGVAVAIPRFLAENRDRPRMLIELLADAIRLELLGTLIVAAVLVALAGEISRVYDSPALAWPLRLLAIALVGQNLLFFSSGVFSGLRRQALSLRAGLTESATELGASVALVLTLGGATAAACGRAVGYAVGGGIALILTVRQVGGGFPRTVRMHGHGRRITRYAVTLVIVDSAVSIFTVIDSLLIGAYISVTAVGIFSAPVRLISVLQYPGYALAAAVSPRLLSAGDAPRDVAPFRAAMRGLTILMAPVTVLTTVWAAPLIHLALGPQYAGSAAVLRGLGPYVFMCGHSVLVSTAMNYLGAARRRIPIAFATVLVNALVDVLLIPRIGVVAGAVGTDLGYTVYVLAQLLICLRMLELPLLPPLLTLARSLIAAAPMALVLAAFGTEHVSVPQLLVGGVLGALVYGLSLRAVGELSSTEVAGGIGVIRKWVRTRRGRE
jgi:O-antigen/teichoic acid export membrane protein